MHQKLSRIFSLDRDDHSVPQVSGTPEYDELRARDSSRRDQVRAILRAENVSDYIDLYHAAWVMNHGDQVEDAELACRLAAESLQAGYEPAKWLYAAAFDRSRMYRGQPQKFGTQIVPDGERYRLWDTEPETTDDERAKFNVRSLVEMQQRAAEESKTLSQPPMGDAPGWLVDAIGRWRQSERRAANSSSRQASRR